MRKMWILALCGLIAAQGNVQAASTVDLLIQKLVEKKILSEEEATQLKGEIAYEEKTAVEEVAKKQVPEWVQSIKVSGDFRGRVQTEHNESASNGRQGERVRGRMRARLNVEAKVNDKAKVVVGIATDGGGNGSNSNNPRSSNYTFSSTNGSSANPFSKPYVVLNRAYGQYAFNDRLSATVGKMDNPFWEPMEFLWDSDITPEGASVAYNRKLNDKVSLFTAGSFFLLNEFNPSTSDPYMFVAQVGTLIKPSDKWDVKTAFSYTGYGNIKSGFTGPSGGSSSGANNTLNTANGANGLKYDYSAPTLAMEMGLNDPFGEMLPGPIYIPRIGLFGEYTINPSPKSKNVAWMSGLYLGNSKVNGWGTWKATAAYKVLAKDAWLDILPDSDFYGGNTGVKGTEGIIEIGLAKNLSFAIDYYQTRRYGMGTANKGKEHLVQYDINWKF